MTVLSYRDAGKRALAEEMLRDSRVWAWAKTWAEAVFLASTLDYRNSLVPIGYLMHQFRKPPLWVAQSAPP